jgi:hypothetical protein
MELMTILNSESVVAAVVGAGLGSLVMLFGTEYSRHRRNVWATRRQLLGEVLVFTYEYVALLCEAQASRLGKDEKPADRFTFGAHFSRMEGKVHDLELRIWKAFPQRHPRAAFRKLCNRLDRSRDMLYTDDVVNPETFQRALDWIAEQRVAVGEHFCRAARLDPRDRARIVFVRFGRVTESDKRALSYEDESPPWESPPS